MIENASRKKVLVVDAWYITDLVGRWLDELGFEAVAMPENGVDKYLGENWCDLKEVLVSNGIVGALIHLNRPEVVESVLEAARDPQLRIGAWKREGGANMKELREAYERAGEVGIILSGRNGEMRELVAMMREMGLLEESFRDDREPGV